MFRAVVDTGSPFVLVDGTCDAGGRSLWGCYRGNARPSGLPDTDELYGGEDVGVQWSVGRFELVDASGFAIDHTTFGVVRTYVGKGGGGAVFLGFAKRRLPRIRPTLLEQTDVASLRFDFLGRTLSLSPTSLIPPSTDAVRVLDMRPRGAPVANYALRISRLLVNGQAIPLGRPAVAVIDSGTTGGRGHPWRAPLSTAMRRHCLYSCCRSPHTRTHASLPSTHLLDSITCELRPSCTQLTRRSPSWSLSGISVCDQLFDSGLLPPQWREARIEFETEQGAVTALEASIKRRRRPLPGARPVDPSAPEFDEFPFIVSPVTVPWFEPGFGNAECADGQPYQCNGRPVGRRQSLLEAWRVRRRDGLGEAPHVLFVGLAFLWQRTLTIDVDDGRATIV
jgi:hypothetical protein